MTMTNTWEYRNHRIESVGHNGNYQSYINGSFKISDSYQALQIEIEQFYKELAITECIEQFILDNYNLEMYHYLSETSQIGIADSIANDLNDSYNNEYEFRYFDIMSAIERIK